MKLRLLFGFLIAGMSISLLAMEESLKADGALYVAVSDNPSADKVAKQLNKYKDSFSSEALQAGLSVAARNLNIPLCRLLIGYGANVQAFNLLNKSDRWPMRIAAEKNDINMIKFLIESGADINVKTHRGEFALMFASSCEVVLAMLTTIPLSERIKILEAKRAAQVANHLTFRPGQNAPMPPKDVRRLITQLFINGLVDQQMLRVKELLEVKNQNNQAAYEFRLQQMFGNYLSNYIDPECVNWNNPTTRGWLRRALEANIRRILFPIQVIP